MTIKSGTCRRCGRCCDLHCQYFRWVSLKNIKKGELFQSGIDEGYIEAECLIFNKNITLPHCNLKVRQGFPFEPAQRPIKCGFKFIEEP